jgi:hypothetical protein
LRAKIVSTPSAMPPPKCTALFIMVRIMGRAPQWRRDIIELAASIAAPSANPTPSPATVAVTAMVLDTMPKGFSGFGGRGNGSMAFPPHLGKVMYLCWQPWKGGICRVVGDCRPSHPPP